MRLFAHRFSPRSRIILIGACVLILMMLLLSLFDVLHVHRAHDVLRTVSVSMKQLLAEDSAITAEAMEHRLKLYVAGEGLDTTRLLISVHNDAWDRRRVRVRFRYRYPLGFPMAHISRLTHLRDGVTISGVMNIRRDGLARRRVPAASSVPAEITGR
jgi:hypothetical protein